MKQFWQPYWQLLKDTVSAFFNDKAPRLGASLSYYTLFSLAPMLLVFLSVVGYFYGQDALQGELYAQIKGLVGADSAVQIQEMVKKSELSGKTGVAAVVGVIMLFIGATGVFVEIQDSINQIWFLKPKPQSNVIKYLVNRFISFSLLVSFGFLFIVSLLVSTLLAAFSSRIEYLFSDSTAYILQALNWVVAWIVMTTLFAIIFSVLPDGKVARKDALMGASVTAILFMIGKYAIGLYLGQSGTVTAYGAAGSVVVILLWGILFFIDIVFWGRVYKSICYLFWERHKTCKLYRTDT